MCSPTRRRVLKLEGPRLLTPPPGRNKTNLCCEEANACADRKRLLREISGYASFSRAVTIVAERHHPLSYNATGNPGMATGGMGDVLTGVCAALIAQELSCYDSARLGAWLCGRAAEISIFNGGASEQSLLPTDVLQHLGAAFNDLRDEEVLPICHSAILSFRNIIPIKRRSQMGKLGELIYHYRKTVLVIWLLIIALSVVFALKLPSVLSGNGFEYKGEYNDTRMLLEEEFGQAKSSIILVFERERTVPERDWKQYIKATIENLKTFDGAKSMISPFDREEMIKDEVAYGLLTFDKNAEDLGTEINQLDKLLKNNQGLTVTMTGEPIIVQDL